MAKKSGVNKSEEIRQILKATPKMKAKEVVASLLNKGIKATEGLVYFIKGKVSGRRGRRRRLTKAVANVAITTGKVDALATILKVKALANEVGGLKKLKAIVEALGA